MLLWLRVRRRLDREGVINAPSRRLCWVYPRLDLVEGRTGGSILDARGTRYLQVDMVSVLGLGLGTEVRVMGAVIYDRHV
jgi:hypothetical protein